MMILLLAWRNIWRNKRRTLITMASIVMAVLLSSVMRSMQEGQYDQMINNTVGIFSGHIQIQQRHYFDEPNLEHTFPTDSALFTRLASLSVVRALIPRIDSYALAAGKERSKAAMVTGIDIHEEALLSDPEAKVHIGNYFSSNNEDAVLIAEGLADFLNISVGDTLVLLGQGYRGMSAAAAFPVKGLISIGIPDLNSSLVYMPIQRARYFYSAENRLTSLIVLINDVRLLDEAKADLKPFISDDDLSVLDWKTLMPELVQAIEADRGSAIILLLILYMVVGFGIFGTLLMMSAERKYEMGVLIAIGVNRFRMALMLIYEMFFITLVGAAVGMILSLPFIYYFNWNPLEFTGEAALAIEEYGMEPFIRFSTDPSNLLSQALIILIITCVISLYPLLHTKNLKPVEAMRP